MSTIVRGKLVSRTFYVDGDGFVKGHGEVVDETIFEDDVEGNTERVTREHIFGEQPHTCQTSLRPVSALPVLSCRPALPCPVLSCPALSCPALPCPALSCPALSCPVLSCPRPAMLFLFCSVGRPFNQEMPHGSRQQHVVSNLLQSTC